MELLKTLGLDSTVAFQFGIFLIVYLFLSNLLFKPYLKAFNKRKEQTVGKTDTAERYISETQDLENEYETKAREINQQFKVIYDESRTLALKEHDRLVSEARAKAKSLTEKAQQEITSQMQAAQQELQSQIPVIAKTITGQVIGGPSA